MKFIIKLDPDDITTMPWGENVAISPAIELEGLHFTIIFDREAALEFCEDVPVILAAIDADKERLGHD